MSDRIMTQHPAGKQGVNIDKAKYDQMREAIKQALEQHGEMAFTDLRSVLEKQLGGSFDGSVSWYLTTVKQDLEARGIIKQVAGRKPQYLRLVE